MNFKNIITYWNYKCPNCHVDISVTDMKCSNCELDFSRYIADETKKKFNQLIDSLPIPIEYWHIWETFITLLVFLSFEMIFDEVQKKYFTELNSNLQYYTSLFFLLISRLILFAGVIYIVKIKHKKKLRLVGLTLDNHKKNFYFDGLKLAFIFVSVNVFISKYTFETGVFNVDFSIMNNLYSLTSFNNTSENLTGQFYSTFYI